MRGGENVTRDEIIHEFELALLKFVKDAVYEGATADEVEALPAVAEVLVSLLALLQD